MVKYDGNSERLHVMLREHARPECKVTFLLMVQNQRIKAHNKVHGKFDCLLFTIMKNK